MQQKQDLLAPHHSLGHTKRAYFSSSQSQCEFCIQFSNASEQRDSFTLWNRGLTDCLILFWKWEWKKRQDQNQKPKPPLVMDWNEQNLLSSRYLLECLCQALLISHTGKHHIYLPLVSNAQTFAVLNIL